MKTQEALKMVWKAIKEFEWEIWLAMNCIYFSGLFVGWIIWG